jgi:hypothetical protein
MDDDIRRKAMNGAAQAGSSQARSNAIVEGAFAGLLTELNRERAGALGRAGKKLEDAIAQAEAFRGTLAGRSPTEAERHRHAELYDAAARARWELEVTREALGIRRHRDLDATYPMPSPLPDRSPGA